MRLMRRRARLRRPEGPPKEAIVVNLGKILERRAGILVAVDSLVTSLTSPTQCVPSSLPRVRSLATLSWPSPTTSLRRCTPIRGKLIVTISPSPGHPQTRYPIPSPWLHPSPYLRPSCSLLTPRSSPLRLYLVPFFLPHPLSPLFIARLLI